MPSGSHAGSSAGHFSGGHSFGGGHFGGHSSHGGRSRPSFYGRPHVMVFMGRRVYLSSGRSSAVGILGVLLILAVFLTGIMGAIWGSSHSDLKKIERDYHTYQAMAERAAQNEKYVVIGTVTDYGRYESEAERYCLYYSFSTDYGTNEGYSFYVYTRSEVLAKVGKPIELAVNMENTHLTLQTDSIPLDYLGTKLTDDAEYLEKRETLQVTRVATFVGIAICVGLLVASIMVPLTAKKATAEQVAQVNQQTSNQNKTPANTWRCSYCGGVNPDSVTTCDACGAKRTN